MAKAIHLATQQNYYFHVPEFDITEDQRNILIDRFKKDHYEKSEGEWFEQLDGEQSQTFLYYPSGISVVKDIFNEEKIKQLINLCKQGKHGDNQQQEPFDYLYCQGPVKKHTDELRSAVLTIPLILNNETSLEFWDDDGKIVKNTLTYNYKTFIFDSKTRHSVNYKGNIPKPRLFWQGSIFDIIGDYKTIKSLYDQNKLFT